MHMTLEEALMSTPPPGNLASVIASLDDADVEFYEPRGEDVQKPHKRDELYFIARGSGTLHLESHDFQCAAGDAIFVGAHTAHRFSRFTNDFATWVVFFGPEK